MSGILKKEFRKEVVLVPPTSIPLSIRKKMGIGSKSGTAIGAGANGEAIRYGDRVLKATYDRYEAFAAVKLMGRRHPNVYRIFDVGKHWDVDGYGRFGPDWIFFIWQEYLDEPTSMQKAAGNAYLTFSYHGIDSNFQRIRDMAKIGPHIKKWKGKVGSFLPDIYAEFWFRYDREKEFRNVESLFSQFLTALEELNRGNQYLKQLGIHFYDFSEHNVMRRGKEIVIIDIGADRVENPVEPRQFEGAP